MAATPENKDDLYYRMHTKTWGRRTAGFLGSATLFFAFGAVGGALFALMPPLLAAAGVSGATAAAAPGIAAIAGNAALFGGAAAWLGITIGADVGANAGAATAMIEEQERRAGKAASQPAKDIEPKKPVRLFNWKVGLLMAGLFAAFGALVALSPITAAIAPLMQFAPGTTAAVVASATALGAFGATMGVNFPHLSAKLSQGYSDILKGKIFEPEAAHAQEPERAVPAPAIAQAQEPAQQNTRSFAAGEKRFRLHSIVEKTEERSSELLLTR